MPLAASRARIKRNSERPPRYTPAMCDGAATESTAGAVVSGLDNNG